LSAQSGPYRHFIPKLELAIERYTSRVPNDGKYYIISHGQIIEDYRSLKKAEERFRELVEGSGFVPEDNTSTELDPNEESLQRYLSSKDIYWYESWKYRDKKGKGGRGGI